MFRTISMGMVAALLPMLALQVCHAAGVADAAGRRDVRRMLDSHVPAMLAQAQVAGVSIAHVERGRVVATMAYGTQSPGVPATPATLYNIASMSKPISAEVVLRLVAAGRVSLDER